MMNRVNSMDEHILDNTLLLHGSLLRRPEYILLILKDFVRQAREVIA